MTNMPTREQIIEAGAKAARKESALICCIEEAREISEVILEAMLSMLPEIPYPSNYNSEVWGRYQEAWQQLIAMREKFEPKEVSNANIHKC